MDRNAAVALGLGLAGVGLLLWQRAPSAFADPGELEATQDPDFTAPAWAAWGEIQEAMNPTDTDTAQRNEAAFLWMIRVAEGTSDANGYRALFGHTASRPRLFESFADHPRLAQRFTDKAGRLLWTSAAGAYQAMAVSPIPGSTKSTRVDTWDRIKRRLQLPDFSPASQDAFALELIREAGALADVRAGRFDSAVDRVKGIWASMPGAGYAQHEQSLDRLRLAFVNAGGTLA